MRIEKAHLYVEKYSKRNQEMLLDFVRQDEFLYFRNNGDYAPDMKLSAEYEPTMLLLYGCATNRKIHEGDIITVDMDELMTLYRRGMESDTGQKPEFPATVYWETQQGSHFAKLFDSTSSSISSRISKEFIAKLEPTWQGSPCALNNLGDSFELRIWDVGQGNTNSISDKQNLTLFDFGASRYSSKAQLENILNSHATLFANKRSISLIISHWDVDHYNLLCAVGDDFLAQLCCIFYPPNIIGLTARQVANRLRVCPRVAIPPASPRQSQHICGIKDCCSQAKYTLFTGEKSNSKNMSGLLLEVHSTSAVAFLTADHSNYQVWGEMYNYVVNHVGIKHRKLHIVVPHHGGNCGKTKVQPCKLSGLAALSVGSNSFGHPYSATITAYRNAGYPVWRTDRHGDIIIQMK